MRKIISTILITALLFSLFSCGRPSEEQKEYGEINAVQRTEHVSGKETENNVLNKLPEQLGYTYKPVIVPRANMSFEIPESWNASIDNARHIMIESNGDKDFPDLRIHLFFRYDLTPPDSEHPEESEYPITSLYGLFNSDRPKTYYPVNGEEYIISRDLVHQTERYDDRISDDSSMILLLRSDDIPLEEPVMGTMPKEKYSEVACAVNWPGAPALFKTVCKTSDIDKTEMLLSYIVSTASYCESTAPSYLNQDLGDFSVKLPEEFVKIKTGENVFISPFNKAAGLYAGMGSGVFDSKKCAEQNYANVASTFTGNPADISLISKIGAFGECNINGIRFEESESYMVTILPGKEYAAEFYRQNQTCYFFSFKRDGKELIIWNCPNQERQYENLYYNCLESSLAIK